MAYNPFNIFRRNQKALFAVLTVVIMIAFTLSYNFGDRRRPEAQSEFQIPPGVQAVVFWTCGLLGFAILMNWVREGARFGGALARFLDQVRGAIAYERPPDPLGRDVEGDVQPKPPASPRETTSSAANR